MGAAAGPTTSEPDATPVVRGERRPVRLRGHIARGDGTTHQIYVLDLSYEGCGIDTPVALEPSEAIKLSVLTLGAIDAVVRWSSGGKAGLVFAPQPAARKKHWPRRSKRIPLTAEVTLRRLGRATFRVGVSDVSPEGCKVELVERPSIDEHVLVKFDGLEPLESEVCWVEGFTAGVKFVRPMHPAVFDLLVVRLS
jgi:hypothetical protein